MTARTLSAATDPCWETNGKWTPVLIARPAKPLLMHILGGTEEYFCTDGGVVVCERFRIVMQKPENVSRFVHAHMDIDPFDWWWTDLPDGKVAINIRFAALSRINIRIIIVDRRPV